MAMTSSPAAAVGAALFSLVALGCGGPSGDGSPTPARTVADRGPVVIQVGPYGVDSLRVEAAARALHGAEARFDQLPEAARRATVEALVAARLVALEAERRGLHLRPEVTAALDSTERALLVETILDRDVYGPLPEPGEEAVADLYARWGHGTQVRAAHILVRTREEAQDILRRLRSGEDFAALARARSVHPMSSARGGDMGFMRRGLVPAAIATAAWDLPAGQVVPEPVRTSLGWHVVKVLDRRTLSVDAQRPALANELQRRARQGAVDRFRAALRRDYDLRYHPETAAAVAALHDTLSGERLLFEWRGGQLDLAGFLRRARVPDPVTQDTARMRRLGEGLVFEDLAAREARRRGYADLEAVRRPLEEKRLALLGGALYEVVTAPSPPADSLRWFFASHLDRFRGLPRVTLREILVDRPALADSLYARIAAGESMEDLARRFTVRTDLARTGGLWRDVDPADPRSAKIHRLAREQGPGLHPPVQVPGGISVFEVLGLTPGPVPAFADAVEAVRLGFAAWKMDRLIETLHRRYAEQVRLAPGLQARSQATSAAAGRP